MKRRNLLCMALGFSAAFSCHAQNGEIDKYVYGLNYDSRQLLSLPADGSTQALPARDSGPSSVIICTNKKVKISKDFDEMMVLNPVAGIVYPGALVHVDRELAEGKPTAISLSRSPVTITVDLPGLTNQGSKKISDFKHSTYQSGLNTILEEWNKKAASRGYVNAARSSLNIEKADSASQLALNLGFSAKWADNKISSSLAFTRDNKSTSTVALFRQVFYTVAVDLPQKPSEAFASGVVLDDIKTQGINEKSPPGYVKSVDYGRLIFVRMDTRSTKNNVDLKGALNYVTSGGKTIDANTKNRYDSIINNSTFTVLTLGGNAGVASRMFRPNEIDQLQKVIKANSVYKRDNPGVPIAYTVSFLKDHKFATVLASTDFMETDCTEYPNGFIKLKHSGGYVAKFSVNWQEKDANGKAVSKSWNSGNQTAGWTKTIDLPGDASSVKIKGEAKTGLAWSPWGEIINITVNGPTNKCYRAKGTTLHRKWDNDC